MGQVPDVVFRGAALAELLGVRLGLRYLAGLLGGIIGYSIFLNRIHCDRSGSHLVHSYREGYVGGHVYS